jgi:WD40 repeat protein
MVNLASASKDSTVKLWSLKDRSLLQTFQGHEALSQTLVSVI